MIKINEIQVRDIISKSKLPTADFVINPYIGCPHKCIYCYAEFMKRFTNHLEGWGDFIDIKKCDKEIDVKKYSNKEILLGSVTDAYNPFETKTNSTREILKQFVNSNVNIGILTKSALMVRDIDIFKQIPNIRVAISINTLDDTVRKKTEPYASSIDKRLEAIQTIKNAGIHTAIFLSPMFPGITDFKKILTECRNYADEFWFENLNLRGAYRPRVLKYIEDYHNNLLPLYNKIYKEKDNEYWDFLEQEIHDYCKTHKYKYVSYFYHEKIRKN